VLKLSNVAFDVTDVEATLAYLDESGNITSSQTTFNVDDLTGANIGTDVLAVNDVIILDTEAMIITAIDYGDDDATETELTVTRGAFGTAAATHNDNVNIEIPDTTGEEFDETIAQVYWRPSLEADGPKFVFDSRIFTFTTSYRVQVLGQKWPSTYTEDTDTIDTGLESFLRERGLAYAARFATAGSSQFAAQRSRIADHAFDMSERIAQALPPQKFRQKPLSRYIPGR
jgi:hypothetical protein